MAGGADSGSEAVGIGESGSEAGGMAGCLAEDGAGIAGELPGRAVADDPPVVRLGGNPARQAGQELGKPGGGGRQVADDGVDGGRLGYPAVRGSVDEIADRLGGQPATPAVP